MNIVIVIRIKNIKNIKAGAIVISAVRKPQKEIIVTNTSAQAISRDNIITAILYLLPIDTLFMSKEFSICIAASVQKKNVLSVLVIARAVGRVYTTRAKKKFIVPNVYRDANAVIILC